MGKILVKFEMFLRTFHGCFYYLPETLVLTYSLSIFRHLRNGRGQQVLVNLSLAMLCSAIIFLVGMDKTSNKIGCVVVAALLHYFILVSFMWMLVEGVLQYLRFVKVLGTYIPRFLLKSAIPAWGKKQHWI